MNEYYKMQIKYIIIMILMLCFSELSAQSLKIVRTDVDSTRSSFVTATFLFGFDIYLEDVEKCRGVSFRLDYDLTDYIHFSEYAMDNFGENALAVVHNKIDKLAKKGSLYIGVGINDDIDVEGFDNPNVIHLEFGVSQSVEHNEELTLNFQNIYAVISTDTGRAIINIAKEPIIYNIHSFVDVWPGDADNNGEVDENDFIPINFYMGYGSATKNMRSFKRRSASTIWAPHKVLAWDDNAATYADCDGNGDVTTSDLLVVNMHLPNKIEKKSESSLSKIFEEKTYRKPGTHAIPIYIGNNEPYTGAAGTIKWDHFPENVKVLGLERGDIFTGDAAFFVSYADDNNSSAQIAFINTDKSDFAEKEGVLAYLIVENGLPEIAPKVESLMGVSPFSYLFPLEQTTSVQDIKENQKCIEYSQSNNHLRFESSCGDIKLVELFDILGKNAITDQGREYNPGEIYISTDNIPAGLYYAVIHYDRKKMTIPLSILR